MNTIAKFKRITNTLNKIHSELDILLQDLVAIDTDLSFLDKMHHDLIYNIELLKQEDIIAVMTAYDQSITQLQLVDNQIELFNNLRKKIKVRIKDKMAECEEYNQPNKILEFKRN
jgi:hypothetical protein